MTTLHEKRAARHFKPTNDTSSDQREHRRYDLGGQTLSVNRWDANRRTAQPLGFLMDLSAGGVLDRTGQRDIKARSQIRRCVDCPSYARSCPMYQIAAG